MFQLTLATAKAQPFGGCACVPSQFFQVHLHLAGIFRCSHTNTQVLYYIKKTLLRVAVVFFLSISYTNLLMKFRIFLFLIFYYFLYLCANLLSNTVGYRRFYAIIIRDYAAVFFEYLIYENVAERSIKQKLDEISFTKRNATVGAHSQRRVSFSYLLAF